MDEMRATNSKLRRCKEQLPAAYHRAKESPRWKEIMDAIVAYISKVIAPIYTLERRYE